MQREDLSGAPSRVPAGELGNELLRSLSPADFTLLEPWLERVPLEPGTTLGTAGAPIEDACFPEASVVGFVDVLEDGRRLAVALTGRDGFVGWPLLLGNDRWPHEALVRAEAGTALKIAAGDLLEAMERSGTLRRHLLRYASSLAAQMTRTIASNLIHTVEARAARWILMYHDRVRGDEIAMTHEELALMLAVRRSSITDALHLLEGAGAIKGHRGRIVVRDRRHLEALAAETYGFAEAQYARLVLGRDPG